MKGSAFVERALILDVEELYLMENLFWILPCTFSFRTISESSGIEPDELEKILQSMEEKGAIRKNKRRSKKHGQPAYRRNISRRLYYQLQRVFSGYGGFPLDIDDEVSPELCKSLEDRIHGLDKHD